MGTRLVAVNKQPAFEAVYDENINAHKGIFCPSRKLWPTLSKLRELHVLQIQTNDDKR